MFPKWQQGRDQLDRKGRNRGARPSPLPTPRAGGVRDPGTAQLPLPDQETASHCVDPHTTQGMEEPQGTWLPAKPSLPASVPSPTSLVS